MAFLIFYMAALHTDYSEQHHVFQHTLSVVLLFLLFHPKISLYHSSLLGAGFLSPHYTILDHQKMLQIFHREILHIHHKLSILFYLRNSYRFCRFLCISNKVPFSKYILHTYHLEKHYILHNTNRREQLNLCF